MILSGNVFSGKKEGSKFLSFFWVKSQIIDKFGFDPYPGTLNVKLTQKSIKKRINLDSIKGIEIKANSGFFKGTCFHAKISNLKCAIIIPEIKNYPKNTLEIISEVKLRNKLNLNDGDLIQIDVEIN